MIHYKIICMELHWAPYTWPKVIRVRWAFIGGPQLANGFITILGISGPILPPHFTHTGPSQLAIIMYQRLAQINTKVLPDGLA